MTAYFRKDLIPTLTDEELRKKIKHCEHFKRSNQREIRLYNQMLKALKDEQRRREPKEKVTFT